MTPYEQSMQRFNWRDELKKLVLLVDDPDILARLAAIHAGKPLSLDAENVARFNRWKSGSENIQ